jgi:hypothetical protein
MTEAVIHLPTKVIIIVVVKKPFQSKGWWQCGRDKKLTNG